jgi:predicted small metal-binding protein
MKQVTCGQLGLSCDYVIRAETEEEIMKQAVEHIWEHHAIKPEEITSEMKVKIKENIVTL